MRQVSTFIVALANAISEDLRDHVAPDKLQYEVEVEVELENQILAQTVQAINEYSGARLYNKNDTSKQNIKRKQALRMMGYCSEMWVKQEQVKGVLMSGDELGGAEMAEVSFS